MNKHEIVPRERIEELIYFIRGQKVMLDADLAKLYQVETKALNRAVRRNINRFPEDFMFQLTKDEANILRCQIGTSILKSQFVTSINIGTDYCFSWKGGEIRQTRPRLVWQSCQRQAAGREEKSLVD